MSNKQQLVLVDGSSYLFRAYHALPPLTNGAGEPTGAIYGVVNMLRKLLADYPQAHFAVVFDPKGRTTRHEIYPEYKANRVAAPDDLIQQIAPLQALIQAMGFPLVVVDGIEADDVIGTMACKAETIGWQVVISTGDKDMAQLVNANITLVNTMTGKIYDEAGVLAKFEVRPDQIRDYLGLIGDTSDNIPGVPKVGPKTAVKWLKAFDNVDNVIAHANEIKGKVGESLRSHMDKLTLSKQLVTLDLNVPLPCQVETLVMSEPDDAQLAQWFQRFEFKRWLKEVEQRSGQTGKAIDVDYCMVNDEATWRHWCEQIDASGILALDTETTSLDAMSADLVGISVAIAPHKAAYIPLQHDAIHGVEQLPLSFVLEPLRSWLLDPNKLIIGQNLKYDFTVLAQYGLEVKAKCFDTMLASYVLNSTDSHGLDALALKHLGVSTTSFEEIAGKGAKQLTFNQIALDVATPYAAEDADIALQLYQVLSKSLKEIPALDKLFWQIEMPTMHAIIAMERAGVLINASRLQQQSASLAREIEVLEEEAQAIAGEAFNLSSPKQLREILFHRLMLPVQKKTATGEPSTDEEALSSLAVQYPLPRLILAHRSLSKLKSTYTDKLPGQVNPKTGRVHTSYNQAVTSTGRFSSTNPNLQNIPIRTEEGRKIREAFIAPEGWLLMAADYSQVELRIMAHLSGDQGLIKAFMAGKDIHRATAAEVFGVEEEHVTADQRRQAKAINFGLIYGMSSFGLARELSVSRHEASQAIDRYFDKYPGVKAYMDQTRTLAAEQGYVETLWGRRLYVPEIHSRQPARRRAAERAAINAPLQGTAADIMKQALIEVNHVMKPDQARVIMQVHDELVLEVAQNNVDQVSQVVKEKMEQAGTLVVPLIVDIGVGQHWEAAH